MAIDKMKIGKEYSPYSYDISKEKIKDFVRATKCINSNYVDKIYNEIPEDKYLIAPPMFAVIFQFPSMEALILDLKIDMTKVMHVKQEFEFHELVRAGDVITTFPKIVGITDGIEFELITIETLSKNANDNDVCKGIYTIIVRNNI